MWTLDPDASVPAWRLAAPLGRGTLAFSTRLGGVSPPPFDTLNLGLSTEDDPARVAENRRRLLATLALAPESLATAGQVHGAAVRRVEDGGHVPACDALLTTRPGVTLAVTTADCMPLLLEAPGAIAAVHAGWRGAAAGLPELALEAIATAARCERAAVRVHLGPCIRGCCYEVGADVAERFPAAAVRATGGRPRLDLPAAVRLGLVAAGLDPGHFHDVGVCTACTPAHCFSHRRDAGRTGRHWAVAALGA